MYVGKTPYTGSIDQEGINRLIVEHGLAGELVVRREDPATALWQASRETWSTITSTLQTVGQMVTGRVRCGSGSALGFAFRLSASFESNSMKRSFNAVSRLTARSELSESVKQIRGRWKNSETSSR